MKNLESNQELIQDIDTPLLLAYYKSKLCLLSTISQSKIGAVQVLNAGIFFAIAKSGLFAVDPDIGLGTSLCILYMRTTNYLVDVENPDSLRNYYDLLLSMLRIISGIVLSRGPQNQRSTEQARQFLDENRLSMVSIFKRQSKVTISRNQKENDRRVEDILDELVEIFVLLISLTGFMDVSLPNLLAGTA